MAATVTRLFPLRRSLTAHTQRAIALATPKSSRATTTPLCTGVYRRFSSMETRGLPVIVCGRREEIGRVVAENLQPEYEVVHFVKTPESGVAELPLILQGIAPGSVASNVGSGNLVNGAKAVILGGGYDDADYEFMRAAVEKAKLPQVPVWLRSDLSIPMPPPGPEYGKAIVVRVKGMLGKLDKEGKMDGSDGGLHWY